VKFHPEPPLLIQRTVMNTDDATTDYHSKYQCCGFFLLSDIVRDSLGFFFYKFKLAFLVHLESCTML